MQVKVTPATPLPITTACDEEFRANAEEGRKYRVAEMRKAFCDEKEAQRRANAYPRLVEALRSQIADLEAVYDAAKRPKSGIEVTIGMWRRLNEARAILHELGEAE